MKKLKRGLAVLMALVMLLVGNTPLIMNAEDSQQNQLIVTNDCDAAVVYTIEIDGTAQDVTVQAHGSYTQSISAGSTYKVVWKEGADSNYKYTAPEQTEYSGVVGQTQETYYVDTDGNKYTADEVSDVVSYNGYSKTTSLHAVATEVIFTRTYSWFTYKYTNIANSSESYSATSASGARNNIASAYPTSSGWGMETDDDDLGYCWVYKTVTKQTQTVTNIELSFTATAELKNQPDITGEFTVAAMNVDGLPSIINSGGPGSSGTKSIGTYISNSGFDLVGVSEDFEYHSNLVSGATGYSNTTWRGTVGLSNVLGSAADTDGLNLLYKNGITVSGESWTQFNDSYNTSGNTYIKKGYRYYQATLADGITIDVYILHADAGSVEGSITSRKSQMSQLADAINANTSGNPIVVIGDTNCRYTRDYLKESFIDKIDGVKDAWVELIRGEEGYPNFGDPNIVAIDKANEEDTVTKDYPDCEVVDKVFYVNKAENKVQIQAIEYTVDNQNYVDSSGSELGDHWPLIVKFSYIKKGSSQCEEHTWKLVSTVNPDFDSEGYNKYECEVCGETKQETIPMLKATSIADEVIAAKGQQITIDVLANDTICTDALVTSKELVLVDGDDAGAIIQEEKIVYTPVEAGVQTLQYAVKYTLNNGTTYTTDSATITIYAYGMADNTYIISEGVEQTFTDVFANDVLSIEGKASEYTVGVENLSGKYGVFSIDGENVVYSPQQYLNGVDACEINAKVQAGTDSVEVSQSVNVVPDTVVYYDDSFGSNADLANGDVENKAGYGIYFSGTWEANANASADYHSSTVTSTKEGLATAEFTFTGTALDIIGQTDAVGGTITVQVWKKDLTEYTNANRSAIKIVNTTDNIYGTLYQIPIIHVDLEERNEYYVKIMLTPNLDGSSELNYGNLYLDGIRIYGVLTQEEAEQYYSDSKASEEISNIYTCLKSGSAVFINADDLENIVAANSLTGTDEQGNEISDADVLAEYIKTGPNREAYIQNGNGIAFYVVLNSGVNPEDATLRVSARMPQGNDKTAVLKYAKSTTEAVELTVTGTSAVYYDIDLEECVKKQDGVYLVVLSNSEDELMSIENIQCSGAMMTGTLENEASVTALEVAAYVRMMAEVPKEEQPAVLKVTIKSLFGEVKGEVELTSTETGVEGEYHTFSGKDVYEQLRNAGYRIFDKSIKWKEYMVEYGTTEEITVR